MLRNLTAALLAFGIAWPALAGVRTLAPVDEAARKPAFLAYRARLKEAVARRDVNALLGLVSAQIQVGFGPGERGLDAFIEKWHPRDSESRLWIELDRILALGGQFMGSAAEATFCAPYVYSAFPDALDPFSHQVVISESVAARAAPRGNARVVARIGYAIVRTDIPPRIASDDEGRRWVEIKLDGNTTAYVPENALRSPVGYRACFAESGGAWKMVSFV